ncbi:hypothetical protein [Ilumatobacter sp.]|uniref:hypothetical protein n=1 Tax=Ilumatobacter sp. TaxID=1967498 RepID=UPI0037539167|nr:hypothetical protein [Ilumatobacter sp.]
MAHETLPPKHSLGVGRRSRQRDLVFDESVVLGRAADLNDLKSRRASQHTVSNLRWLKHTVTRHHPEGLTLVLVDNLNPPSDDENHLESDAVKVDVVLNVPAIGN